MRNSFRVGRLPEELAFDSLYLAFDFADRVTAAILPVNRGLMADPRELPPEFGNPVDI